MEECCSGTSHPCSTESPALPDPSPHPMPHEDPVSESPLSSAEPLLPLCLEIHTCALQLQSLQRPANALQSTPTTTTPPLASAMLPPVTSLEAILTGVKQALREIIDFAATTGISTLTPAQPSPRGSRPTAKEASPRTRAFDESLAAARVATSRELQERIHALLGDCAELQREVDAGAMLREEL
eukprot:RCo022381